MKLVKALCISILVLISFSSYAEDEDDGIKFTFDLGLHQGGDTLVTAYFTDGSTETIDAGDGASVALGAIFSMGENLELVTTYGIKNERISASNGNVDWTRFPLNVIVLYKNDGLRIGGGLTYHTSNKIESSGAASISADFDNALGTLLDMRYYFNRNFYFGARATYIEYKVSSTGQTFNGDSIGITFGYSN